MGMILLLVANLYFLAGISLMVFAKAYPTNELMKMIMDHGRGTKPTIFHVSKNNFVYFYVIGTLCGIYSIYQHFTLLKFVFVIHLFRRFLENHILFQSNTVMHLSHLIVGMTFYPMVWILLELDDTTLTVTKTFWIFMFLITVIFQSMIHLTLSRNSCKKKLPMFWPFDYIICPNFTCEIVLYFIIMIMIPSISTFILFVFVSGNQIISALQRKEQYPKLSQSAIFYPFL
ncbi:hypothetical protein BC833DRAFT_618952 [Globomyces pollinis-pini]|nr:hypothetical protein BC833DRAFT_618952 [Globomyces pollinis-pini]